MRFSFFRITNIVEEVLWHRDRGVINRVLFCLLELLQMILLERDSWSVVGEDYTDPLLKWYIDISILSTEHFDIGGTIGTVPPSDIILSCNCIVVGRIFDRVLLLGRMIPGCSFLKLVRGRVPVEGSRTVVYLIELCVSRGIAIFNWEMYCSCCFFRSVLKDC